MEIVVSKFGGTSMQDAQSISRVVEIVQRQGMPNIIVVSAAAGITDQLLNLGQMALSGESWKKAFQVAVKNRHQEIIKQLKIELDLNNLYTELENVLEGISLIKELSLSITDYLMSFGERMSSLILWQTLKNLGINVHRFDTKDLIMTDNNYSEANVDFLKTNERVSKLLWPLLNEKTLIVLPGFIGQSVEGKYSTLGRGGSDYTGAIIAAALNAKELLIWTDVAGIYSSDPKLIREARVIPRLSFAEAGELAYFGAKVLHPKTILPTIKKNIPVRILNTFNPDSAGTLITAQAFPGLKALTFKRKAKIVNIYSVRMLEAYGFLARIFAVFAKYKVVVDVLTSSEVSVSLTIDSDPPPELIEDLSRFSEVSVVSNQAIICLVGEGLTDDRSLLGELFSCLGDHSVKMISQGASRRNLTFVVEESEVESVTQKIFNKFFLNQN